LAAGRISPGSQYRLPTEAEWECSARAGTSTRFSYGDDPNFEELANHAWYWFNSDVATHAVGQKAPNPWGLYDMEGNGNDRIGMVDMVLSPTRKVRPGVDRRKSHSWRRLGFWRVELPFGSTSGRRSPFITDYILGFRVVRERKRITRIQIHFMKIIFASPVYGADRVDARQFHGSTFAQEIIIPIQPERRVRALGNQRTINASGHAGLTNLATFGA
jgi:hypothetical protein